MLDPEKLKDPTIHKSFQAKIGGRFAVLNFTDCDLNEITNKLNSALHEMAEKVLGKQRH